jgi:glutaminyl-tRNA synthetase
MSHIHTRFPPEPNFYLHFGHLKSLITNFELHKESECILRLDDTNPETETQEYVKNIQFDVEWLGFKPCRITYTSDYFEQLHQLAFELVKSGRCYMDFSSAEQIKSDRHNGIESIYRNYPIEYHLKEFENMATYNEGLCVLRMKIDMNHSNHNLRDPIAYRIKKTPHYKTGTRWSIYPSYDFSHRLVDSFESITHSYCTMEFYVRRDLYYWPLLELNKIGHNFQPAEVIEFGKLTVEHNILSKRKIKRFVSDGLVESHDDPRLLTIAGLRKRGFTSEVLKNIARNLSIARHDNLVTEATINYYLRKHLDETCDRMFAVLDPIQIEINNLSVSLDCIHPNNPKLKSPDNHHITKLSNKIYINGDDFRETDDKNYYRLTPNKIVRLKYSDYIEYLGHVGHVGHVSHQITCKLIIASDLTKKIKGIIHWVSEEDSVECLFNLYENLLLDDDQFNSNSKLTIKGRIEKSVLNDLTKIYQFERVGYFKYDRHIGHVPVFSRVIKLQEFVIPKN